MKNEPLPFALPPSDPTPSRPPRVAADPMPLTPRHDTDLPLPLSGNSGSSRGAVHAAEAATLRQLLDKLDRLIKVPAGPPLDDVDSRTIHRWAEEAAEGLVSRRDGLKLIREVERVLAEESFTRMRIRGAEERLTKRLALVDERAAGSHWRRRDAGRRAKHPTHVDVDPAAWRRAKAVASRKGMTIGHYVGTLVRDAAEHGLPDVDAYATTARLFARVDVDKPTWNALRSLPRTRCDGRSWRRGARRAVSSHVTWRSAGGPLASSCSIC